MLILILFYNHDIIHVKIRYSFKRKQNKNNITYNCQNNKNSQQYDTSILNISVAYKSVKK